MRLSRIPDRPGEVVLPGGATVQGTVLSSNPSSGGNPVVYSQAAASIAEVASGFEGANWTLTEAVGIAVPSPWLIPFSEIENNCTIAWIGTPLTDLYIPTTPLSATPGSSNAYIVVLESSSTPTQALFADVLNGTATLLFTQSSGFECGLGAGNDTVPTDVLDSPEAVTLANVSGGAAFLSQFPTPAREWIVAAYSGSATWLVIYVSACGTYFETGLNAIDGATLGTLTSTLACEYSVNFTETGLPMGTTWSVTINGGNFSITGSSFSYSSYNGSLGFTTWANGFTAEPASGSVTVAGANVTIPITFTELPGYYPVTFVSSGLAAGTFWDVIVNSEYYESSTQSSIQFLLANGDYTFFVYVNAPYNVIPSSGAVTVAGAAVSRTIDFTPIPTGTVTFIETGLPSGILWYALVGSVHGGWNETGTTADNISFSLPYGSDSYEVGSGTTCFGPSPHNGTVVIGHTPVTIQITFALRPGLYAVVFNETGLPAGSIFNVSINGSFGVPESGGTLVAYLPNGSFPFQVATIYGYVPVPATGTANVTGGEATVTIAFSPVAMYLVTFNETGLSSDSGWYVSLDNANSTSTFTAMAFYAPNGSIPFTAGTDVPWLVATPASGTVLVDGALAYQTISFAVAKPPYRLTFEEFGLTAGTSWNVTVNGGTNSSTGDTITFLEPNGSYSYLVGPVPGWSAIPSSGGIFVDGYGLTLFVLFVPSTSYQITLTESGIPAKTLAKDGWTVELDGTTLHSTMSSIEFIGADGVYEFVIAGPSGYRAAQGSGWMSVSGVSTWNVVFSKGPTYAVAFHESGLPKGTSWCISLQDWTICSDKASLKFANLTPGDYEYVALPLSGQTITARLGTLAIPPSWMLMVSDRGLTVVLKYVYPYTVTFRETGLPIGTNWSVTVKKVTEYSTDDTITFDLPNGTNSYKVGLEVGYTHVGTPGSAKVAGGPASVAVTFHAKPTHSGAPITDGPACAPGVVRLGRGPINS